MSLCIDIKKKFKSFSLNVKFNTKNKSTGLLGASGSGKSMTLKCIAGIETPDSGKIILNDRVLFDSDKHINIPPQKRNVGYLFQNYALFPHMNVEKNIACGMAKSQDKDINKFIRLFKLEGMEKKYPAFLSGGQQQRVALARILASSPEMLLFDEPFSALDAHLKEEILIDLLDIIAKYDGDIAVVTHNRNEAYKICDDLIIIDNGNIKEQKETKDLFDHCETVISARITGCKNIIEANKHSENSVFVPSWNCVVQTTKPVAESVTHIGIRAHNFKPIFSQSDNINTINVHMDKIIENPFHWDILLSCGTNGHIWWKFQKEVGELDIPKYIHLPPENIMLLHQ